MRSCISCIDKSLGIVYPFVDVGINIDLAVNNPGRSYVVGVYTVCIIDRGDYLIAFVLQFSCGCNKCVPVSKLRLNLCGIICSENFLSGFAVVDHNAGAALP